MKTGLRRDPGAGRDAPDGRDGDAAHGHARASVLPPSRERVAQVEEFRQLVGNDPAGRPPAVVLQSDKRFSEAVQLEEPQAVGIKQAHITDFDPHVAPRVRRPAQALQGLALPLREQSVKATGQALPDGAARRAAQWGLQADRATFHGRAPSTVRTQRTANLASTRSATAAGTNIEAMLELLLAGCARAAGQPAAEFVIVPPSPNPLQISLAVSMHHGEVTVRVRSGLAARHRPELQRVLGSLEKALSWRLGPAARPRVALLDPEG